MNNLTFIQIKPKFNDSIISRLNDITYKSLNNNSMNTWNLDIIDFLADINDNIKILHSDDPINYINLIFKSQTDTLITPNDNIVQYYNTHIIDCDNNQYTIMLTNNIINTSTYLQKISNIERQDQYNLLASLLTKFCLNSLAIFGDVYIIKIDQSCYDNLNNTKQIQFTDDLYADFNTLDIIKTYANIYYVKIYAKPFNKPVYYQREILDNFILNNKFISLLPNIIEAHHQNIIMYIKYIDPLPDSYQSIMATNEISNDQINNMYFINLNHNDIDTIRKSENLDYEKI
jgi:hypothetical protein